MRSVTAIEKAIQLREIHSPSMKITDLNALMTELEYAKEIQILNRRLQDIMDFAKEFLLEDDLMSYVFHLAEGTPQPK